jgi:hypothetical protein
MAAATNESFRERVRQRRAINAPIAWLDRGVPLLEDGHGPLVVGVSRDAVLGKRKLRELEARVKERTSDTH